MTSNLPDVQKKARGTVSCVEKKIGGGRGKIADETSAEKRTTTVAKVTTTSRKEGSNFSCYAFNSTKKFPSREIQTSVIAGGQLHRAR